MLIKKSFIELRARERAKALLDSGSFRELLGPSAVKLAVWLPLKGLSRAEAWVKCQAPRWRRCLSLPSKTLRQGIRLL